MALTGYLVALPSRAGNVQITLDSNTQTEFAVRSLQGLAIVTSQRCVFRCYAGNVQTELLCEVAFSFAAYGF